MVLDNFPSPQRRSQNPSQNPFAPLSPAFRKSLYRRDELGSWSTIIQRHRFLLTAVVLLGFLCTIYLYFAVTLGAGKPEPCSGLTETEEALCRLRLVKDSLS